MCGIAGLAYADPAQPADRARCPGMTDIMRHRGPRRGAPSAAGVGPGHRRLSIIDVVGGDQPIFNGDRSKAVILNGEIYNYQALRARARGPVAASSKTRSDTRDDRPCL